MLANNLFVSSPQVLRLGKLQGFNVKVVVSACAGFAACALIAALALFATCVIP